MLLVLTACIEPKLTEQLKIKNASVRIQQYEKALDFYIKQKEITKIVFCDNSGYNLDNTRINLIRQQTNKEVEIISFKGNLQMVKKLGKGYGEGEIMDYVFRHSELLKQESRFLKITGRLIVKNINRLVRMCKSKKYNYFNGMGAFGKSDQIDTRLFIIEKSSYELYFQNCYLNVNDREGFFLERLFMKNIKYIKDSIKSTKVYPDFVGQSGTTGKEYNTLKKKQILKTLGNLLIDLYNPKWRVEK